MSNTGKQDNKNGRREKCLFYHKVGACRHGKYCSKTHTIPEHPKTIVLRNFYNKSAQLYEPFDSFYQDVFIQACKYGEVINMVVCENECDHLNGNVYIKYANEESCYKAFEEFNKRWYDGKPIFGELSHVIDFKDSVCLPYDNKSCNRIHDCNFMHIKRPSYNLKRKLLLASHKQYLQKT
ncbi:uncharacterized protein SCDLUD_001304 [Saccharomycodes ludwigii]|uniref:uncharacterized protein n=1 Tax=Saccharomycodes ludwigii TaxID=36035 RepID=UPI001E86CE0C|nr:hypothetical protein SCDLUD_001304 [Saccharomycodes ludwigii]KAH3903656.1 hypothetical protein SCDLUD_001304 [Saccharomycodes ludwigii]